MFPFVFSQDIPYSQVFNAFIEKNTPLLMFVSFQIDMCII